MKQHSFGELKPFALFDSYRLRFTLLILLIGTLPVLIVGMGYIHIYENRSVKSDVTSVTAEANLLNSQILTSGYLQDQSNEEVTSAITSLGNAYSGRVMLMDASLKVVMDSYNVDEGKTLIWKNVVSSLGGETLSYYDKVNQCITVTVPVVSEKTDSEGVAGVLLINKSTEYIDQNKEFIYALVFEMTLIMAILSLLLGIWISGRSVQPIRNASAEITIIQNGGELKTLTLPRDKELRELYEKFNDFMQQMEMIDESRQEFVSNVSHELKTPLTSMKVLADSINSMGEGAPIELYQEFMQDIGGEIDRETKIINDLLTLVKLDKSGAALNISQVNINDMLESLMKRLKPIAEEKHVELVLESFRPVTADVDEVKFSLAIMNLIENGIKYNKDDGFVHVSINSDHQYFYIRVEDSGLGIPEDSIEYIFERFYRVDKSHSREIGGTGLGLAITKNAITMHHGEIKVQSQLDVGTVFNVRVPLSYIEQEE